MGVIVVHSVALGGTGKHTKELTREGIATARKQHPVLFHCPFSMSVSCHTSFLLAVVPLARGRSGLYFEDPSLGQLLTLGGGSEGVVPRRSSVPAAGCLCSDVHRRVPAPYRRREVACMGHPLQPCRHLDTLHSVLLPYVFPPAPSSRVGRPRVSLWR